MNWRRVVILVVAILAFDLLVELMELPRAIGFVGAFVIGLLVPSIRRKAER